MKNRIKTTACTRQIQMPTLLVYKPGHFNTSHDNTERSKGTNNLELTRYQCNQYSLSARLEFADLPGTCTSCMHSWLLWSALHVLHVIMWQRTSRYTRYCARWILFFPMQQGRSYYFHYAVKIVTLLSTFSAQAYAHVNILTVLTIFL